MAYDDSDQRNSGFINFSWDPTAKTWKIGGTFTTDNGAKKDLGYVVTGPTCFLDALEVIGKQMGPTLAGKGIDKRDRTGGQKR